jgi:hypothetical protein
MKVMITENEKDGLLSLMGQRVTLMCANYFYTGVLVGVNKTCVKLESPAIVYETGPFTDSKYKDEQSLNTPYWYVRLSAIESFGVK